MWKWVSTPHQVKSVPVVFNEVLLEAGYGEDVVDDLKFAYQDFLVVRLQRSIEVNSTSSKRKD
jgi:hypothetical protein